MTIRRLFLPLAFIALLGGCAKRVPNLTPLQSTQLTLSQSLNVAAHGAHAFRLSAQTLQAQGTLPVSNTREILGWVRQVDIEIEKATPLSTAAGDPKQIAQSVLDVIGAIPQLPASVKALDTPQQKQEILDLVSLGETVWNDIKTIVSAANSQKASQ